MAGVPSGVICAPAICAVGFFADRLKGGLQRDALQLLGGDAVVSSDNPTPANFVAKARELGLSVVTNLGFPTMARATDEQGGAAKLVALKVVEPGYPLRGALRVASAPDAPDTITRAIPARGQAWVDAALLEALGLKMGDTLLLGDARLIVHTVIVVEPDRGAGFMNFAPRVMINTQDIAATKLIQPASRLTYRMAVAGDEKPVQEFVAWADAQVKQASANGLRGVRVESLQAGRPEMSQTLDRADKFLSLVALLAALLSAVAVALACLPWRCRRVPLRPATSTIAPCCGCWACANAPLRPLMRLSLRWWACLPAAWAWCLVTAFTTSLSCCWPGW